MDRPQAGACLFHFMFSKKNTKKIDLLFFSSFFLHTCEVVKSKSQGGKLRFF
jgi:hypothetical protein